MQQYLDPLTQAVAPLARGVGMDPTVALWTLVAMAVTLIWGVVKLIRERRGRGPLGSSAYTYTPTPAAGPKQIRKQAEKALKAGRASEASRLFAAAGDRDRALAVLVDGAHWTAAAEMALEMGRKDKAASLYERAGQDEKAAELMEQIRQFEAAAKLWRRAGKPARAAPMVERLGKPETAAQLYADGDEPGPAAEIWIKLKQYERAAPLALKAFERAAAAVDGGGPAAKERAEKWGRRTAKLLERIGDNDAAERVYREIGDSDRAAELAASAGRVDAAVDALLAAEKPIEAAELLAKAGRETDAARIKADAMMNQGDVTAAAKLYARAGETQAAIESFLTIGLIGDAARTAEQAERYEEAGGYYLKARDGRKAAECFEHAKRWDKAAALWQKLGDSQRAIRALTRGGKSFEAALHLARGGELDRALELLEPAGAAPLDDERARLLAADLHLKKGDRPGALERYAAVLREEPINASRLESGYRYAMLLESEGHDDAARAAFKAIMRYDPAYRDVRERYKKLAPAPKPGEDAPPSETETAKSGAKRRRYVILEELGRGGMGVVYKAMDRVLDRIVALKVLPANLSANEMVVKNFFREAKSAAALSHSNIVTVFDAGEEDETYYIAMEYIQGPTLKQMVRDKGPFPIPLWMMAAVQTLKGLGYAHNNRIVHRDIKPSNLMWVAHDKLIKITDFGLAKVIQEVVNFQTVVGGTPHYMSPEQILGEEIDARADLYSLGASLYELATASVPYPKGDAGYHHIHSEPPDPRRLREDFPPALAQIVMKLMAKERDARYDGAEAVLAALDQARGGAA